MGNSIGRVELPGTGTLTQVFANPTGMRPKIGGVSIDWSKVTAPVADVEFPDGTVIPAGEKYLRYGSFISKITKVDVKTITMVATGGTFTATVTMHGESATTEPVAYNASAQVLEDALNALYLVSTNGGANVEKAGSAFTITFAEAAATVTLTTDSTSLTGDDAAATVATTTAGDAHAGWYGPYDATATDGRQNRVRGEIFFINRTVLESDEMSNHPPAFEGGTVFTARLDLGASPKLTRAQAETVFPELKFVSTAN